MGETHERQVRQNSVQGRSYRYASTADQIFHAIASSKPRLPAKSQGGRCVREHGTELTCACEESSLRELTQSRQQEAQNGALDGRRTRCDGNGRRFLGTWIHVAGRLDPVHELDAAHAAAGEDVQDDVALGRMLEEDVLDELPF